MKYDSRAFAVLGLDVRRTPTVDRVGDARRLVRGIEALEGVDAIVDLASDPNQFASWKTVIRTNIASTTAVLEAARRANVPRVIVASSNHVTGGYLNDQPYASILAGSYEGLEPGRFPLIGVKNPVRPDGPYAVGKVFAEVAGRYYADTYGLSVICLRIGHVNRENRPKHTSHWATLLTHRDLVELVRVCLTAPTSVRFGIFYGVSDNTWRIWDIDDGRKLLGYEPRDDVEALR